MSLFDSISFTECAACRTGDCFNIDEWMIWYHYNDTESSVFYYGDVTDYDDVLWELSTYIRDHHVCPHPQYKFNFTVYITSLIMFDICLFAIFMLCVCLLRHIFMQCYYKCHHIRVSKRPSFLVLLYSIGNKYIVFVVMIWWAIKISMFVHVVQQYCDSTYSDFDPKYCKKD
eukprot:106974_1